MNSINLVRNQIIDKLFLISNKKYLDDLHLIVEQSPEIVEKVQLTDSQIVMFKKSNEDYKAGRYITHEQLEKEDSEWLGK
jgi:hypothetical protein